MLWIIFYYQFQILPPHILQKKTLLEDIATHYDRHIISTFFFFLERTT